MPSAWRSARAACVGVSPSADSGRCRAVMAKRPTPARAAPARRHWTPTAARPACRRCRAGRSGQGANWPANRVRHHEIQRPSDRLVRRSARCCPRTLHFEQPHIAGRARPAFATPSDGRNPAASRPARRWPAGAGGRAKVRHRRSGRCADGTAMPASRQAVAPGAGQPHHHRRQAARGWTAATARHPARHDRRATPGSAAFCPMKRLGRLTEGAVERAGRRK